MWRDSSRVVLFFVLAAATAFCTPLTWTLVNATFNDGGTATGSFVFDADTGSVTSWNIATTAGTTLASGFTYNAANSYARAQPNGGCPGPHITFISMAKFPNGLPPPNNYTEDRDLCLTFASALTNAGGTVKLDLKASDECFDCDPYRLFTGGSLPTEATIESGWYR